MRNNLANEIDSATAGDKLAFPGKLTDEEFILFNNFVEIFKPICILTDAVQKDGLQSHHLIPRLLQCYGGKQQFSSTFCIAGSIKFSTFVSPLFFRSYSFLFCFLFQ